MTTTIYALSSGAPPAALAVVRISGPRAGQTLIALAGRLPQPRRASLAMLIDPTDGEALDQSLLLWFPGPASATGEDLAELHLHGGRAVVARVLAALATIEGLVPAGPGDFTRRAFENGRIDLAEAEGLADLLFAETELQRRSALASAGGALGTQVSIWLQRLLMMSAQAEALLDFSDEDDVSADDGKLEAAVAAFADEMDAWLRRPSAERLRDGIRVALAGPPNAGKSTLLNALAGREAAIVSPRAGTTRDLIEVPIALAGRPFLLVDMAGLHEGTGDEIEAIGIARAHDVIASSDIILWLGDEPMIGAGANVISVHARADLPGRADIGEDRDVALSATTGDGMDRLVDLLIGRADALLPVPGEVALNARQRGLLLQCHDALSGYPSGDMLLLAESLRLARLALDRITGRAGTEDMLNALFGRFCIGK